MGLSTKHMVLARLRAGVGYVSGQALSEELGVTRPAIWKHVESLRAQGYQIEAVPRMGYRLVAAPDLLTPEELTGRLKTRLIGTRLLHYDCVESTNETAKELARAGEPEGTVVIAESQGEGRGRLGRPWLSPPGGIYLSVILRPAMPPVQLARVTIAAAVSVAAAIRAVTEVPVSIKWPNDVLIDGKKLVGILTEMAAESDAVAYVVVGIGVNANTSPSDYPEDARSDLTSLAEARGFPVDRLELCASILRHLEEDYLALVRGRFSEVLAEWKIISSTIGRRVRVSTVQGDFDGKAVDIGDNGELVVAAADGSQRAFSSGEVEHLRST